MNRLILVAIGLLIILVFFGRPHISTIKSYDAKFIRDGRWSYENGIEIIGGTPASGIPICVTVSIIAEERFYWGDGDTPASTIKNIKYDTYYSDSSGNVHIPSKKVFNYIWKSMFYSFVDRIDYKNMNEDYNVRIVH